MGLASLNAPGTQGALFQVVSHGLIAALLFFLLGVIEQRFEHQTLQRLVDSQKVSQYLAASS